MLPTGKEHISFSEIKTWSECSFRHYLAYVKKVDMFVPNVHVSFGTAVHNTIENFLKTKQMDSNIARDYLEKYLEDNSENEKFKKYDVSKEMEKINSILEDVPKFLDENFENWEYVNAEEALMESLERLVESHKEIKFKGYIDCVIAVPGKKDKKMYWLIDWKTASRPWDRYKIEDAKLQLVLYKKFWSEKHGIDMKDIRCGFVTLIKSAKSGSHCRLIPVSVGDTSAGKSLTVIDNFLSSVKDGMKIKNRSACRWCDFKDTEHCP